MYKHLVLLFSQRSKETNTHSSWFSVLCTCHQSALSVLCHLSIPSSAPKGQRSSIFVICNCFTRGNSDFRIRQIVESRSGFSTYLWYFTTYLLLRPPYLSNGITKCFTVRTKENSFVRKVIGLDNSDKCKAPPYPLLCAGKLLAP